MGVLKFKKQMFGVVSVSDTSDNNKFGLKSSQKAFGNNLIPSKFFDTTSNLYHFASFALTSPYFLCYKQIKTKSLDKTH